MAEEDMARPWGYLPAEQHLIRNWDPNSSIPAPQQRVTLIRSFLSQGSIPAEYEPSPDGEPSRVPTESEIQDILAPWRSPKVRKIACQIWGTYQDDLIILRTHYGGEEDDERLSEWLEFESEEDQFYNPDNLWWRILDDEEFFNFGAEWEKVLDILPELVGRQSPTGRDVRRDIHEDYIADAHKSDDPEGRIQILAHFRSAPSPLLVADENSFQEDKLRVLFLDGHGNIVRDSSVSTDDMVWLRQARERGALRGSSWWDSATLGEKYTPEGEIGRVLYPSEQ